MKQIEDIIADQRQLSENRKQEGEKAKEKQANTSWMINLVNSTLDRIQRMLYRVEVINQKDFEPALRAIEKAVKEKPLPVIPDNKADLVAIKEAISKKDMVVNVPEVIIPDNKKELLSIEKAVKGIVIPEVKIPEPKEADYSVLVKELKTIQRGLTTKESVDTLKMEKSLSDMLGLLEKVINKPEKEIVIPTTDNEPLVKAQKETTKAINNLVFPVPNFSSSWQHSLTMQSQDLATTGVYKTVNSRKVQDYVQFTGNDGNIYRNTFSYDADGDWIGHTGWIKQ